jgi:hypothetical protein
LHEKLREFWAKSLVHTGSTLWLPKPLNSIFFNDLSIIYRFLFCPLSIMCHQENVIPLTQRFCAIYSHKNQKWNKTKLLVAYNWTTEILEGCCMLHHAGVTYIAERHGQKSDQHVEAWLETWLSCSTWNLTTPSFWPSIELQ